MYKAIIADDEIININIITKLLNNNFVEIEIVACATSVEEIITMAEIHNPHILFLDINLGDKEVFEALNLLHTSAEIIFISSEQQHAIKAFRYDAADFVLKPITKEIFITAVTKVLQKLKLFQPQLDDLRGKALPFYEKQFITISSLDKHEIFKTKDILYCMADGRCTAFHLIDGRKIHSSKNLTEFDYLLKRHPYFIKISRHYLVNFEYVKRIIKKGGPFCEFIEGSVVPISRRKLIELNKMILSQDGYFLKQNQ
jgi:two-component system LytT family response regulator